MTQEQIRIRMLERELENAKTKAKADEEWIKILVNQVLEWQSVAREFMPDDMYDKECERIDDKTGFKKALKID